MKQIRYGVFETNSSSSHTLTLVSLKVYEQWEKGELVYNADDDYFVPINDLTDEERVGMSTKSWSPFYTHHRYFESPDNGHPYKEVCVSPKREYLVVFGTYFDNEA